MAYISPTTRQIIKYAFEASAPGFMLKDNAFANLACSVSYTLQRGHVIIPSVAGSILSHPHHRNSKFLVLIRRMQKVLNGIMAALSYALVVYQNGTSINNLKLFVAGTPSKTTNK